MTSRETSEAPRHERKKSENDHATANNGNAQVELSNMSSPPPPQLPIEDDLMGLARLGELRSIQKLFDTGKHNANSADPQGITALHWAAINGHLALCHFLIQQGANVNAKGGDAEATPVLWASKKCNLDIVNLLLQNGADPLITDDQGYNLLHSATLDGNVFQLILLLHQPDIPVDVPDTQGHTSLMWAAYKGYPTCVDVLLKWGASVEARDQSGFTALHWALVKGSYACIQKLVEFGADRFASNNDGKTPAVTAKEMNSTRQWHRALSDSNFDPDGNPRQFPLPFVKDVRKFLNRFFFLWPIFVLGCWLEILTVMPIYWGIPGSMLVSYGLQWLAQRLLKWAPSDMKNMHKTPFLAGVFAATLLWVGIRWVLKILPNTWSSSLLLNMSFALCYFLCGYFYVQAMILDPGYIPKSGSRGQQKAVIEELLSKRAFNEQHFCSSCMIRKPLRSKHCRKCNRCVAREDHHCPWVDNCVGINNHRAFVMFIIFLMVGDTLLIRLTLSYLEVLPTPSRADLRCYALRDELCEQWTKDPFTLLTNGWGALQLTWVTMLFVVQLVQIARAMTTYESMRHKHPGPITTALATGSITMDGAQVNASGAGPDPTSVAGRKPHQKKEGCFAQWKKLLGLDTFIATAMHGSKAGEVMARRRENPFTHGVFRNCGDFWCDAGGVKGVLFGSKQSGAGLLGGEAVDYRKMYEVPKGGMRYRGGGGYEAVGDEEDV